MCPSRQPRGFCGARPLGDREAPMPTLLGWLPGAGSAAFQEGEARPPRSPCPGLVLPSSHRPASTGGRLDLGRVFPAGLLPLSICGPQCLTSARAPGTRSLCARPAPWADDLPEGPLSKALRGDCVPSRSGASPRTLECGLLWRQVPPGATKVRRGRATSPTGVLHEGHLDTDMLTGRRPVTRRDSRGGVCIGGCRGLPPTPPAAGRSLEQTPSRPWDPRPDPDPGTGHHAAA